MNSTEIIFMIEDSAEGGYEARAVGDSIFTEADTIEELKANIKDAVSCHFDKDKMPSVIRLHYVKEELMSV